MLRSCPTGVLREVATDFTVDARALTKTGGPHVAARVVNPSGATTDTYITDHGDGTYRVEYTPYEDGEGPQHPSGDPKTSLGTSTPTHGPQHPQGTLGTPRDSNTPRDTMSWADVPRPPERDTPKHLPVGIPLITKARGPQNS